MQQGGYATQTRLSPTGLGIVIALHAGALAAILLAPPEKLPAPIRHFIAYNVPDPPPPPPNPPEHQAQPRHTQEIKPVAREVRVPDIDLTREISIPIPPIPPDSGTTIQPQQPPAHVPVLTEAAIDPARARDFQPDYPPSLIRQGVTGRVVVRVRIGVDGRVKEVERVSATDPLFFEATRRQALSHWRFTPATRDGVAVESWRQMSVRFEMPA